MINLNIYKGTLAFVKKMADKERWVWLNYKGKQILLSDYTGLSTSDIIFLSMENKRRYDAENKSNILLLVDVTGCPFDQNVVSSMHDIAKAIKPRVKKSAVVGVNGLKAVVLKTINRVSDLGIAPFKSREDALEWLIKE
jgi:hypothetical protein